MSSVIYYYSGTGNSLYVAKQIAEVLPRTKIVPMASLVDDNLIQKKIVLSEDYVGFVFPVYFNGLPEIVERFLSNVHFEAVHEEDNPFDAYSPYVYAIATMGAMESNAIYEVDRALDGNLNFGAHVKMVDNYIRMFKIPESSEIESVMDSANEVIAEYIGKIVERTNEPYHKQSGAAAGLGAILHKIWKKTAPRSDRHFSVGKDCISCGICYKVCSAGNITMVDGRPSWRGKCQDCLGCINICPVKAIQIDGGIALFTGGTSKKGRYLNPEININEMIL